MTRNRCRCVMNSETVAVTAAVRYFLDHARCAPMRLLRPEETELELNRNMESLASVAAKLTAGAIHDCMLTLEEGIALKGWLEWILDLEFADVLEAAWLNHPFDLRLPEMAESLHSVTVKLARTRFVVPGSAVGMTMAMVVTERCVGAI
jgi:hypothetical protein